MATLLDSGLFKSFSHEAFNSVKDIDESCRASLDDEVKNLAHLLKKYKLSNILGISRIHNHFKLNPGEIVKVSIGCDEDSSTTVEKDVTIVRLKAVQVTDEQEKSVPYMWAYDSVDKKLFPLQHFDHNNPTMKNRLNQLCTKMDEFRAFSVEFIQFIEKTGTQNDFGFYIRYEDLVKFDKNIGEFLMEDTDVVSKRQWMVPKTTAIVEEESKNHPEKTITITHWSFNDDGTVDGTSCGHCCGHGSCGHCCYHK
ncbi:unnamed protein product [Didymodactylos carnosus]|uniref:Uncharacterized protein n=1 Tax=Didymodactylos carnosus TaxID=1234261 RepID=A0A814BF56_9BILA|nr:unnamed protein product [Didymodactylos carnosus]CAF0933063.1 unnamed protein product [Didymodactylos carnosus]CAF3705220.1 unnamed protein product [Didymodactylos carnosus]CAF3709080.1 unnamed protein product [Didymodactylos carnosus]